MQFVQLISSHVEQIFIIPEPAAHGYVITTNIRLSRSTSLTNTQHQFLSSWSSEVNEG